MAKARVLLGGVVVVLVFVACGGLGGESGDLPDSGRQPPGPEQPAPLDGAPNPEDSAANADAAHAVDGATVTDGSLDAFDAATAPCAGVGRACVDPAPAGWARVKIYTGAPGAAVPNCAAAADEQFTAYAGLQSDPATCSSCDVGAPLTVNACTLHVTKYQDVACGMFPASYDTANCASVGGPASFIIFPNTPTGTCAPAPAQAPVVPPVSWTTTARACATASVAGACVGDANCVSLPEAPFETKRCIYKLGDEACPGATYVDKRSYDRGVVDTRSCSNCTATFSAICPLNSFMKWNSGTCGAGMGTGALGCLQSTFTPSAVGYADPTPQNARCIITGGAPTGTAVVNDRVTVCCAN